MVEVVLLDVVEVELVDAVLVVLVVVVVVAIVMNERLCRERIHTIYGNLLVVVLVVVVVAKIFRMDKKLLSDRLFSMKYHDCQRYSKLRLEAEEHIVRGYRNVRREFSHRSK